MLSQNFCRMLSQNFISIGCAISAPDGSTPRVYLQVLVAEHRLKDIMHPRILLDSGIIVLDCFLNTHLFVCEDFFLSFARPSLPMGVDPEAMVRVLATDHRLKFSLLSRGFTRIMPSLLRNADVLTDSILANSRISFRSCRH
jgi:hypothetical protein